MGERLFLTIPELSNLTSLPALLGVYSDYLDVTNAMTGIYPESFNDIPRSC